MATSNFCKGQSSQSSTENTTASAHSASISEARRALKRERDRTRARERRALMTEEELSLRRQQARDQYARRKLNSSQQLYTLSSLQSRSPAFHSTPRVLAPVVTQPVSDEDITYVVDVLRGHAMHEVSRLVGTNTDNRLSIPSGSVALQFGDSSRTSFQPLPLYIPPEDYIDMCPSDHEDLDYTSHDTSHSGGPSFVPQDAATPRAREFSHMNASSSLSIEPIVGALPSPGRHRGRKSPLQKATFKCARNYVDSPTYEPFVLLLPKICPHCSAKLFPFESSTLCCKEGKISLPYQPPPDELLYLYTANTPEARHFQQNTRAYNHVFSFTSMGVQLDSDLASGSRGIYTYRAQGAIYHRIGSLLPKPGEQPRFLQVYIFDTDHELQNRLAENETLNPQVLAILKRILDNHNAFVRVLRHISARDNVSDIRLHLKESRTHGHQYSLPSSSEVAAILIGAEDPYDVCDRDIIVQTTDGQLLNVPDTAGFYDPLQYPLLHPYGEFGWDLELHKQFPPNIMSCRAYYCYILQIRQNHDSLLLLSRRLLQQFAVDTYVKISTQQLRYIRDNQVKLRAELYQGLKDSIINGETRATNLGRRVILPASYIGSPRDMHKRYYDAMSIVQKFGKPDLFVTMTCNLKWPEILRELRPGETAQDRPDITTRIFHSKCEELKQDLFHRGVLGKVVARVYVIEFQKRGLPHVHMLLILSDADKLRTPNDFDSVVRAEIPDRQLEPDLFRLVVTHMIHGPCVPLDMHQPCVKEDKCKRFFPKAFADATIEGVDSYPIYRRRRDGPQIEIKKIMVDNRWVVPYNPWLLRKYDCHLNVEVCSSIKCVKYLYKYIYKGADRCSMEVADNQDEVKQFIDGRWISSHEALWRIFRFPLNQIYPAVYSMQVHLHNMHEVQFPDDQELQDLIHNDATKKTMLTEFFYKKSIDPSARQYLYREFPEHYTWSQKYRCWNDRVGNKKVIGRLHTATPADPERYYLRLLLNHVRGPTSYESLKTVKIDDIFIELPTFKAAAEKLGLLENDTATRDCLTEASSVQMPAALIQLFGSLLVFCNPIDARVLWEDFKEFMILKYPHSQTSTHAINSVLADLQASLSEHNKSLSDYGLPSLPDHYTSSTHLLKEVTEELSIETPEEDLSLYNKLNSDQRYAFHVILDSALRGTDNSQKLFFIDGPGGSGKTFLYRALLAHFRRDGLIAIATATSGLAAIMMSGGRTAHSRFKIPFSISATSTCKIHNGSGLAHLLQQATIIIWDEATMGHKHLFEAFDRSLRDIMGVDDLFGGKLIVFGGDFRQVLPVVPQGSRTDIVNSSLRNSYIWDAMCVIPLEQNMRALSDPDFSQFLLRVGNGTETSYSDDLIMLPDSILLPWETENSIEDLMSTVFPSLSDNANNSAFMMSRVLITTTNDYVDHLNKKVLNTFPGENYSYFSFDSIENDPQGLYQVEFLNSINQGALPPHQLNLKIGCPIMLTRNVEPRIGLCNGTRLLCRHFYPNFIDAEIVSGTFKGDTAFLHRIPLNSTPEMKLPFQFTRKQFPIRLSFALTVHKAQGQTIPFVGIYLPHHVFTHGQLYVALSRGKSSQNTRILVEDGALDEHSGVFTKNIVYNEVLL